MAPSSEAPSAVFVDCPECGEETLHSVLKGRVGEKGGYTLEATVKCTECGHVHPTIVREAADRTVPVVVSEQQRSWRSTLTLPGDEELTVDEVVHVDERPVQITALQTDPEHRVEEARVDEIQTIWARVFDKLVIHFSINMGKKTISKAFQVEPDDELTVGQEFTFGRLRVTAHAIKVEGKLLRRGTAVAHEVKRVFARPTPPEEKPYRPPKPIREARARAERESGMRPPPRRGGRGGRRRDHEDEDEF